jgi:hypothetical protein
MTFHAQKQANRPVAPAGGVLQRKCDKCRKKKAILQRYAADLAPDTVPPVVHEVLRLNGSCYFFTVALLERYSRLLTEKYSRITNRFRRVKTAQCSLNH